METTKNQDPSLTSGTHQSFWIGSSLSISFSPLSQNIETEIVIIGGGLAGISIAYALTLKGKKVVLVEDGNIGSGETGRTTAHLVTALDDRYYQLEKYFGDEQTKLIAESHAAAIDFVEENVKRENINCDFERLNGYLFLHPSDDKESLTKEFDAATRSGLQVSGYDSIPGVMGDNGKCICFPNQAQFHPLKYLDGLCKAITARGGKIFTSTHAAEISSKGIVTDTGFEVKSEHVVVATNTPVNNNFTMHMKQYPYRTYVIGAMVKKGVLPKALWWDTGDFTANADIPPYHYVRLTDYDDQYDLLISGGEDHPTGDTSNTTVSEEGRYELVESWTRKHFPIEQVIYRWSGQVLEPMDGIAFIGRNPYERGNVYIVTGDSGNGMTHCSIAALLIPDLIMGLDNPWKKLYSPWRTTLRASGSMFKQMMHEYVSYLKQWPGFADSKVLNEVVPGQGKIVDIQEEKFGVYRDEAGSLHIVSAECSHLKCTVSWNGDEKSWDCPCHGSRFTLDGKVINGPANRDLPYYQEQSGKQAMKEVKATPSLQKREEERNR